MTDDGISISSSEVHLANEVPLIVVKFDGVSNVTCFNELHSEKELTPISVMVDGMTRSISCLILAKQFCGMILMDDENVAENWKGSFDRLLTLFKSVMTN